MQDVSAKWQSWNPVTGCTKVSEGCRHCYAERFAERWRGIPGHPYERGFELQLRPERLEWPLHWRAPRRVFVVSMGDLFHERVPDEYIAAVFGMMERTPRHVYQLVTKRAARLGALAPALPWPPNLWMGVTIEHMQTARRADTLRAVPAAVRWICAEPLLGPLDELDLGGIDWVVTGAESGPHRRPARPAWTAGLRDRCAAAGIPFYDKQARNRSAADEPPPGEPGPADARRSPDVRRSAGGRRPGGEQRTADEPVQGRLWSA